LETSEQAERTTVLTKRSGLFVGGALLIANVANYGFQIVTGRLLSIEEYGLLAGFMSAVTIITVTTSALQTAAARAIAAGENEPDKRGFFDALTRTAMIGGVVCAAGIAALSPIVSRFLNIGILPIFLLGLYVLPSALDSIAAGRLQGSERFSGLALYSAGQAIAKVSVAAIVLAIGLHVTGIIAGLCISCAIIAIWGSIASRPAGAINTHVHGREMRRSFGAFLLFWVILSADIAFARAFFEPKAAGVYAAAAVLGKAVLWLPSMASQLLFPQLADRSAKGLATDRVMRSGVLLILTLSVAAVIGLRLFGEPIFTLLYGSRYDGAADIAWKIGLAMFPLALVNLRLLHFLARGQGRFLWWMSAAALGEVLALYLAPKNGTTYAVIIAATGVVLLASMTPRRIWRGLPFTRQAVDRDDELQRP